MCVYTLGCLVPNFNAVVTCGCITLLACLCMSAAILGYQTYALIEFVLLLNYLALCDNCKYVLEYLLYCLYA